MLPTFVEKQGPDGKSSLLYLNSLKRFCYTGVVVPSQANSVVKIPAATSAASPGTSLPIPLEGPQDAHSEFNSLTAAQGVPVYGLGLISSTGGPPGTVITGVGTKFLTQVAVGDTIGEPGGQNKVVASITSDTSMTVTGGFNPNITSVNYIATTAINTDVQQRMTCLIQDMAYQRYLMNNAVPVLHIFGDNQKPCFMAETLFLQKNQVLRFQFFNNSTLAGGSISFAMEARKWLIEAAENYPEVAQRIKGLITRKTFISPYWFTFDILSGNANPKVTLPANGGVDAFMTNTGSNYLFLFYAYGHGISSGVAGDTQEKFTFAIHDGETSRPLTGQGQDVTLNTGLGTAQNPFWLNHPIIVKPRNNLRFKLKNLITDASTDAYITLGGVAVMQQNSAITDPDILEEARRIYKATKPSLQQVSLLQ